MTKTFCGPRGAQRVFPFSAPQSISICAHAKGKINGRTVPVFRVLVVLPGVRRPGALPTGSRPGSLPPKSTHRQLPRGCDLDCSLDLSSAAFQSPSLSVCVMEVSAGRALDELAGLQSTGSSMARLAGIYNWLPD